jgi:hypothetical protein
MAARNTKRIKIKIQKELCVKLAIYKYYIEMHGQQNIKKKEKKKGWRNEGNNQQTWRKNNGRPKWRE